MPDVGWQELLVIAVVAIVVVGPRELPQMMRAIGRWMGQARRMAREFQNNMQDLAREVEMEDLRNDVDQFKQSIDPYRPEDLPAKPGAPDDPAKRSG